LKVYEVKVARAAASGLKCLDKKDATRIIRALEKLRETPRPRGVEKLTDRPGFFRLRSGDYRIIYTILEDRRVVVVLVVRHRKDVYRNLDCLDEKLATAIKELSEAALAPRSKPV
jgi:mRNA interferase RelE/StbE